MMILILTTMILAIRAMIGYSIDDSHNDSDRIHAVTIILIITTNDSWCSSSDPSFRQ